jgi:imidazole glycerol-phosphate synthase subunit HisH
MSKIVHIIDYGMSNLLSISRAFEHVGASVKIIHNPDEISQAGYLVLPGVGAFPDAMTELNNRNLTEAIKIHTKTGKPLLGVCLGMQLLLSRGFEIKETEGLALIPGEVKTLPKNDINFKVPNINWHSIFEPKMGRWKNTVLDDVKEHSHFYFVHSFHAIPENNNHILALSNFGKVNFAAAVINENIVGTQFHPEKSAEIGLKLISNFLRM